VCEGSPTKSVWSFSTGLKHMLVSVVGKRDGGGGGGGGVVRCRKPVLVLRECSFFIVVERFFVFKYGMIRFVVVVVVVVDAGRVFSSLQFSVGCELFPFRRISALFRGLSVVNLKLSLSLSG
jgi:hypothetical protein